MISLERNLFSTYTKSQNQIKNNNKKKPTIALLGFKIRCQLVQLKQFHSFTCSSQTCSAKARITITRSPQLHPPPQCLLLPSRVSIWPVTFFTALIVLTVHLFGLAFCLQSNNSISILFLLLLFFYFYFLSFSFLFLMDFCFIWIFFFHFRVLLTPWNKPPMEQSHQSTQSFQFVSILFFDVSISFLVLTFLFDFFFYFFVQRSLHFDYTWFNYQRIKLITFFIQ